MSTHIEPTIRFHVLDKLERFLAKLKSCLPGENKDGPTQKHAADSIDNLFWINLIDLDSVEFNDVENIDDMMNEFAVWKKTFQEYHEFHTTVEDQLSELIDTKQILFLNVNLWITNLLTYIGKVLCKAIDRCGTIVS